MEEFLGLEWSHVLKAISRVSNSPCQLDIPDTLLFSQFFWPCLWVYTTPKGQAVFKELDHCSSEYAVFLFLEKVQRNQTQATEHQLVAVVLKNQDRVIVELSNVHDYLKNNSEKILAIQIFRCGYLYLQKQIISHTIVRQKSSISEKFKIRPMQLTHESKTYFLTDEKLKQKVRAVSDLVLNKLSSYKHICVISITLLYQVSGKKPWLSGISWCKCVQIPVSNLSSYLATSQLNIVHRRRKSFKKFQRTQVASKKSPYKPRSVYNPSYPNSIHVESFESGILQEYADMKSHPTPQNRPLTTNNLAFSQVKFVSAMGRSGYLPKKPNLSLLVSKKRTSSPVESSQMLRIKSTSNIVNLGHRRFVTQKIKPAAIHNYQQQKFLMSLL